MIWSRPDIRVLFVCTANICRSPLAEALLRHRLSALDLADRIQVRSAGTHAVQRGCRPDPRVEQLTSEAGVSLAGIRARILTQELVRSSDYVLVMEHRNLEDIGRLCPELPERTDKVKLLGSFLPIRNGNVEEIPDPYFGDLRGFYNVYQMIDSALTGFLHCMDIDLKETSGKP